MIKNKLFFCKKQRFYIFMLDKMSKMKHFNVFKIVFRYGNWVQKKWFRQKNETWMRNESQSLPSNIVIICSFVRSGWYNSRNMLWSFTKKLCACFLWKNCENKKREWEKKVFAKTYGLMFTESIVEKYGLLKSGESLE